MEKLLELILQLQKKDLYLTEIEKSEYNYYILYFGHDSDLYYCSVSEFAILSMFSIPQEVRNILRTIQFILRKEKLEKEIKLNG